MSEQRTYAQLIRRTLLPLLISGILIVATIIISGSALLRIEDVYVNRIVAGTYGAPDWRVQEMNPILAQLLTLLYRVVPSVNWYGVLLLALLFAASATWLHFAARSSGGLLPATAIVAPIVLLAANSLISTVVCAFCASAGAFSLMNGISRQKDGTHQRVLGALLSAFALSLSMKWGLILTVGALLCYLPGMVRENRMRGFLVGLPALAIIAAALFGYSSLMYSAPELSAYRENYALYEQLQHSSLKEESDRLNHERGEAIFSEGEYTEESHDHEADDHDHSEEEDVADAAVLETVFDAVGWSLNDSFLFFTRYSADSKLTDPDTLRALSGEAQTLSFDIGRLLRELLATVKKPQFLLLIALLLLSGLSLMLTRRNKGFVTLLCAIIAFGGHIFALLSYYNAYADIAPFYLLAIAVLLYHFNGEDARKWFHEKIKARLLRIALCCAAALVACAAVGGLFYYTRENPANANNYTVEAFNFITPYVSESEKILFVGDNPHDRIKPDTLKAPVRGADENLLAGSYDLYSPRAKAQKEHYGIENPLIDCLNREDIGYIMMTFSDSMALRLADHYQIYLKPPVELASEPNISERIYLLSSYTDEELSALLAEKEEEERQATEWIEALDEAFAKMEAEGASEDAQDAENSAATDDESEQATKPAPDSTSEPTPEPTGDG